MDVRRLETVDPPQRRRVAALAHARVPQRQGHAGGRRGRLPHGQPAQFPRQARPRRRRHIGHRVDLGQLPPVGSLAHARDLEPGRHALRPRHRRDPGRHRLSLLSLRVRRHPVPATADCRPAAR
ncbi:protein of unknown function [Burkholderia multivorans]